MQNETDIMECKRVTSLCRQRIYGFFREADADIFCIQESKLQERQIELPLEGYHQYWNYAEKKGYSGTALFTKKEPLQVTYGIGIEEYDREGRVITAEYEDLYVVTVYTPNSQQELARLSYRMTWEKAFLDYINGLKSRKSVVFCGDLNVAHQEIDLKIRRQTATMQALRMRKEAVLTRFWHPAILTLTAIFIRIRRAFIPGGHTGLRQERRTQAGVSTIL